MLRLLVVVAMVTSSFATARAENADQSYGAQVVVADVAGILGVIAAAPKPGETSGSARTGVRYSLYVGPAPIIHALHGRWKQSALSLALHLAGALAADGMAEEGVNDPNVGGTWLVLVCGAAAIAAIDASQLAHVEAPSKPAWQPTVATGSQGFVLGIARSF